MPAIARCVAVVAIVLIGTCGPWTGAASGDYRSSTLASQNGYSGSERDIRLVDRWCRAHFRGVYAGLYFSQGAGGRIVIGFTRRQRQHVRRVRELKGLTAPRRVVGFSVVPKYSVAALEALGMKIANAAFRRHAFEGLINTVGEDIARNVVTVGTERVFRVRHLIANRYGKTAPVRVEFATAPEEY